MSRVLIIKLGYRPGLASVVSRDVSLSSVLRSTVILNLFRGDEVFWVTTAGAVGLLSAAPGVKRVLAYDSRVSLELGCQTFDVVVNLEAGWEFCALAQSVNARLRFGYSLDGTGYEVVALPGAGTALALELSRTARRRETRPHQQVLYELMGKDWQGEPLVLGRRPGGREEFDVGFNMSVGEYWLSKTWPHGSWVKLEELLFGRYSISYERAGDGLSDYIEWVNSCRILVSGDALGLHLALALGKKVVALFGPTAAARCHTSDRGIKLTPPIKLNCIPCCEPECRFGKSCVSTITPEQVAEAVEVLAHTDVLEK